MNRLKFYTMFQKAFILAFFVLSTIAIPASILSAKEKPATIDNHLLIPDTPAGKLLTMWLKAHNTGTEQSLKNFIDSAYSDILLLNVNLNSHLHFLIDAYAEFGKLNVHPFAIDINEENSIIARFLKDGITSIDMAGPQDIVIVEIDADPNRPDFLYRGLTITPYILSLNLNQ